MIFISVNIMPSCKQVISFIFNFLFIHMVYICYNFEINMTISTTRLYDLLSIKVGKETAETLTTYIEEKIKDKFEDNTKILATKEDVSDLKRELKNDIANVRQMVADTKADLIKWMFIFWVGQVAVTFGFILLFLKR